MQRLGASGTYHLSRLSAALCIEPRLVPKYRVATAGGELTYLPLWRDSRRTIAFELNFPYYNLEGSWSLDICHISFLPNWCELYEVILHGVTTT